MARDLESQLASVDRTANVSSSNKLHTNVDTRIVRRAKHYFHLIARSLSVGIEGPSKQEKGYCMGPDFL